MNLSQFETAVSNELGLNTTSEKTTIDDAINLGVLRVLEDTRCYVKKTDFTGFDGTSTDYTMDSTILDIVELQLTSAGTVYSLERLSVIDLLERRRTGQVTGSPVQFYAVTGANLLMFYPAPGTSDTLSIYNVPIPTALSASGDDPSTNSLGGVPTILHRAVFYWACAECASYDDDATSQQGERYRALYDREIVRYRDILRKRGGSRNARAVVNDKRRRRAYHTNDVYPAR